MGFHTLDKIIFIVQKSIRWIKMKFSCKKDKNE